MFEREDKSEGHVAFFLKDSFYAFVTTPRLHLPPTPPVFRKNYPSTFIIFYHSEIQCEVPDFPQAAPTYANAQLASYKVHTTLYLEKPS